MVNLTNRIDDLYWISVSGTFTRIFGLLLAFFLCLLQTDLSYAENPEDESYKLKKTAWVARQQSDLQGEDGVSKWVYMKIFLDLASKSQVPGYSIAAQKASDYMDAFNDPKITNLPFYKRFVMASEKFAMSDPPTAILMEGLISEIPGVSGMWEAAKDLSTLRDQTVEQAHDRAKQEKDEAFIQIFESKFGRIGNTLEDILADNQDLKRLFDEYAENNLDAMNEVSTTMADMRNLMSEAAAAEIDENKKKEYDQRIAGAQSSVYVLSTLVGFGDPKLGNEISVVGNSTIQITKAITEFNLSSSNPSNSAPLAAAIMTGNILGAAMQIFSLFGGGGPSIEQQIMEQIKALSRQMESLRGEMHTRFDRVDAQLYQLNEDLFYLFDILKTDIDEVNSRLDEIRIILEGVDLKLTNFQRDLNSILDAGFNQDFTMGLTNGLNYKRDYPYDPLPYETGALNYKSFVSLFHNYATAYGPAPGIFPIVKDVIRAGPFDNERDYLNDDKLYYELMERVMEGGGQVKFAKNMNFLSQYIQRHFCPGNTGPEWCRLPLFSGRLGNPVVWSNAANAYISLARDWPWHAARVSTAQIDDMVKTGEELQQAIRVLSEESGSAGRRNIFNNLIELYRSKIDAVMSSIRTLRTPYEIQYGIDVYGSPDQATSYVPIMAQIPYNITPAVLASALCAFYPNTCPPWELSYGSSVGALTTPNNLVNNFNLPNAIRMAHQLGVGTVSVNVYSIDYVAVRPQNCPSPYCPSPIYFCYCTLYPARLVLSANYNGIPVTMRFIDTTTPLYRWEGEAFSGYAQYPGEAMEKIRDNWVSGENIAYTSPWQVYSNWDQSQAATALTQATTAVSNALAAHRQERYGVSLSADGLKAAKELSGVKRLLEAYASLGLARSLDENDNLRSLLFGAERLLDGEMIVSTCQSAPQSIFSTQPPADYIQSLSNSRISALSSELGDIFAKIDSDTFMEAVPTVDMTLAMLRFRKAATKALTSNDFYYTKKGIPLSVSYPGILENDKDQLGSTIRAQLESGTGPSQGTLELNQDGSFTYRPSPSFVGIDTFNYRATDGILNSDVASVTIHVTTSKGDFDQDGDVDLSDLAIFAQDFGRTDCSNPEGDACQGDFDGDGDVDASDLNTFTADFGM